MPLPSGVQVILSRMKEVGTYLQQQIAPYDPQQVLCLFDIDMTLLQPDHPATYLPNVRQHEDLYHAIQKQYPEQDVSLTFAFNFLLPQRVVDPDVYDVLQNLSVKTISLTATLTGDFLGTRMEVRRYEHLKENNFSFENTFPQSEIILCQCPCYRGNYPVFYKGILLSNSERGNTTKGTVLCAFLQTIGWTPQCVLLVDDRVKNHADMEEALQATFPQTRYVGIEFTGAENYCPQPISAADFQAFWSHRFEQANRLPYSHTQKTIDSEDWFKLPQ